MFHIFAVSDASGITAERVVRAAMVQFDAPSITISRHGNIRSPAKIRSIVTEAARSGGFIVHTFVYAELREAMLNEGRKLNVMTIDLMGPLLARLTELLDTAPRAEPGLFQPFDSDYQQRIEAIDYTVRHDDGRNVADLDQAEIVLLGVSRTSKTPLSIYLSYRGWKVANVPLILGVDPPETLFHLPKRRVVGLIIRPDRLVDLRTTRVEHLGTRRKGYADLEYIQKEIEFAYRVFERRKDWPLVDVTTKPIEETAAEVVALVGAGRQVTDFVSSE
jgi:hypothetical protein